MAELGAAAQVRAMILPTRIPARRREWETFKDPQSGCDYLYNTATGESKWAGSAADQVRSQLKTARREAQATKMLLQSQEKKVHLDEDEAQRARQERVLVKLRNDHQSAEEAHLRLTRELEQLEEEGEDLAAEQTQLLLLAGSQAQLDSELERGETRLELRLEDEVTRTSD